MLIILKCDFLLLNLSFQNYRGRKRKPSTVLRQYASFYQQSPQDAGVTMHVIEDLPRNAVPLSAMQATPSNNLTTSLLEESALPARYKVKVHSSRTKFSRKAMSTVVKDYKNHFKNSIRFPKRHSTRVLDSPKKRQKSVENPPPANNDGDPQA